MDIEEKWIYVYYTNGSIKKTAYILKNAQKSNAQYISHFLEENHVSDLLITDIENFIANDNSKKETDWQRFTIFLIKMLSFNVVICIMLGLTIFGGYKLGTFADDKWGFETLFTIIGVLSGLILGGTIAYVMIMNYLKAHNTIEKKISSQKIIDLKTIKNDKNKNKHIN
ncbi:AtpZ/AtpI family protein [Bacillus marasmi]|uniref:AtpZ/AtpI family protein n=1 Tax=Bacillus marasmi TaxID=1926279 RepID=UPI0011CA8C2E|nr:AtpZ/AtpI family protein [Bacillus marasmi]